MDNIKELTEQFYIKSQEHKNNTQQLINSLNINTDVSNFNEITCQSKIPPWERETTEQIIERAYNMLFDETLEDKEPTYPPNGVTSYDVPDPWNYIWIADYIFELLQNFTNNKQEIIELLSTAKIKYVTDNLSDTVLYRKEWLFEKDWTKLEMWAEKNNPYYIYCTGHYDEISVLLEEKL